LRKGPDHRGGPAEPASLKPPTLSRQPRVQLRRERRLYEVPLRATRPGLGSGRPPPDPEMTAHTLSAVADEAARLLLTDPERYPVGGCSRTRWVLDQLGEARSGSSHG
jgi:hypothetical protein